MVLVRFLKLFIFMGLIGFAPLIPVSGSQVRFLYRPFKNATFSLLLVLADTSTDGKKFQDASVNFTLLKYNSRKQKLFCSIKYLIIKNLKKKGAELWQCSFPL